MRVLMISGDKNMLCPGTGAHARYLLQAAQVEQLEVVVWPQSFFAPFFARGPFDVVTSQDPFWRGLVAWFAARRLHARLNIQIHATLSAQSFIKSSLSHLVLKQAGSVRAVSASLKEEAAKYTSVPTTVLPVFVDIAKFAHIPRSRHPRFAKTILWVGRFESEKDPLYALEVLAAARKAGVDAGLLMLGSGSLFHELRASAQRRGLFDFTEFPGWKDSAAYLGQADVVLCTSQAESWGASIVEALAAGVAVVAPDVGIAREAGARVVSKQQLASAVIEALTTGARGTLQLALPSAEEWAIQWKNSL